MKIDATVMEALELLGRERGVSVDAILDALANALVSAYKRSPGAAEEARVTIDPDTGDITVYAQDLDDDGNVTKEWEDTPDDFGRIAAQTAKQVIQQRLRDAKREQVFEVYAGREGDLVTAIVQQVDGRFTILDLGDAEAILPGSERIPYERLDRGNRVKALILEVRNETKGPQIVVSRSHPDLVRRLLELEVPELADGTVELVAIAREPGHRTKIAVVSHDPNVDPKGACVGARGSRVRQVVNELRGEKVDVVQWRENTAQFIAEALGPAKVKEVKVDEEAKVAEVIVSDHQLSLAIGKEGQNARLAARLSGYKVDIRSDHVPEPPPAPAPAPAEPTMPAEAPAPAEEQAASTAPEEEPAALVGADSQPEEQLTTEAD
ncbi:MAG: transcription termination factor NusA [Actinobacteria bacterium]|nr:transcription termination factor NusA [Actinomycetota bacterium]